MFNAYGCNLEGLVVARASRRAHNTKVLTRSGSNGHFLRVACAMNGVAHVSQTDVSDLIIDGPQQKQHTTKMLDIIHSGGPNCAEVQGLWVAVPCQALGT